MTKKKRRSATLLVTGQSDHLGGPEALQQTEARKPDHPGRGKEVPCYLHALLVREKKHITEPPARTRHGNPGRNDRGLAAATAAVSVPAGEKERRPARHFAHAVSWAKEMVPAHRVDAGIRAEPASVVSAVG